MTPIFSHIRLIIAAVTAVLLTSAVPAQQAASPWLSQVTRGANGSHILGNPSAPVRVTEYVSYTCSHCKDFVEQANAELRRHIASGRVNLEVRHLVLSAPDIGMTVAAQCGNAGRFFSRHESLFALQPSVLGRTAALSEARVAEIVALAPLPRNRALAIDNGVIQWMRGRGFTAVQIDRCFADQAVVDRIETMRASALAAGISGTPSFAINGQIVDGAHSWAALQPRLDAAVAAAR